MPTSCSMRFTDGKNYHRNQPFSGAGMYGYRVPQDCLFVVQDHPGQGTDSQVFGGVPLADVEGKVMALMRHRGI